MTEAYASLSVSICFAATWIGGDLVIGIAETVYDPAKGLIWALIPLNDAICFSLGRCLFSLNLSIII